MHCWFWCKWGATLALQHWCGKIDKGRRKEQNNCREMGISYWIRAVLTSVQSSLICLPETLCRQHLWSRPTRNNTASSLLGPEKREVMRRRAEGLLSVLQQCVVICSAKHGDVHTVSCDIQQAVPVNNPVCCHYGQRGGCVCLWRGELRWGGGGWVFIFCLLLCTYESPWQQSHCPASCGFQQKSRSETLTAADNGMIDRLTIYFAFPLHKKTVSSHRASLCPQPHQHQFSLCCH